MKKEFMRVAILVIVLCLVFPVTVFASNSEITVYVDGKVLETDVPPIIENGRTLVPMRAIFEALGAEIAWDGETKTITATKGENTVIFVIDEPEMTKNGEKIALDVPAKIVDGRTLVPVRAVCDGMGADVAWDPDKLEVKIVSAVNKADDKTVDNTADNTEGKTYKFNELSDNDYKTLTDQNCRLIRFNFEMNYFPKVVLDIKKDRMVGYIKSKSDDAVYVTDTAWCYCIVTAISDIQEKSDDKYATNAGMSDTDIAKGYLEYIYGKKLNAEKFFDVSFEKLKGGGTLMLITYKTTYTDALSSKYIGVVLNPDDSVRYFAAQTDGDDKDKLVFGESYIDTYAIYDIIGTEKSDFIEAINTALEDKR